MVYQAGTAWARFCPELYPSEVHDVPEAKQAMQMRNNYVYSVFMCTLRELVLDM